jgi:hypothetical protein
VTAVSRRTLLLGAAGTLALTACGDGTSEQATEETAGSGSSTTATAGGLAIAKVFAPTQPVNVALRLPLALADAPGALLDDVPASISVRWALEGDGALGAPVEVKRRSVGIPTPYFPLEATFERQGTWRIQVEADGAEADTTVTIVGPGEVAVVPGPGEGLLPIQTPTTTDGRGVEPICTRDPACPFHEQTLEEALGTGKAIAFIISTPQFCQTAICGPVLDLLVERHEQLDATIAFVHAEVYTDSTARTTTEAVSAYGLTYEPALFLAAPDGTITTRLDYTFDATELDEALSKVIQ